MRKLRYIFLLFALVLFFAGCLKNSDQVTGPAGTQGAAGAPGGNFLQYHTFLTLKTTAFSGAGPYYYDKWVFNNYNPNGTYLVNAYVSKLNGQGVWNKLPYANVYQPGGDNLSVTLTKDTVKIWYYNSSSQFPTDSLMDCTIIVIPQQ